MRRLILVVVLVLAACDGTPSTRGMPVGADVTVFYLKDANSGRCLRFESMGRNQEIRVATDVMCSGEGRLETENR